jgi:hypothetical protein
MCDGLERQGFYGLTGNCWLDAFSPKIRCGLFLPLITGGLTYSVLSEVPEALRIKRVELSRCIECSNITLPMGIVNYFFLMKGHVMC